MEPTNKDILDQLKAHDKSDMAHFQIFENKLDSVSDDVKDIKDILKGAPDFKRKGLVEMVDAHETIIKKAIWTAGILMAIGSLLGFVVSKL